MRITIEWESNELPLNMGIREIKKEEIMELIKGNEFVIMSFLSGRNSRDEEMRHYLEIESGTLFYAGSGVNK